MIIEGLHPFELKHFNFKTLSIESRALKNNPLGDSCQRKQFILHPKKINPNTPVIFYLSGFASDAWKNFSFQGFDSSTAEEFDQWTDEKLIPPAVYVFVNAWTKFGGSQFINSDGAGQYEDYIMQEIVPAFKKALPELADSKNWIIMGGSSGGYGAIHLGSKFQDVFPHVVALAPDSFFDVSLKPEIYKYLPYLKELGGVKGFAKKLDENLVKVPGDIMFGLKNLIAMTTCYAPVDSKGEFKFPVKDNGNIDESIWSEWLKHDPIHFLSERHENLKRLKAFKIFTGDKDEHGLQYGSRQIDEICKKINPNSSYTELSGTHRNIKQFRCQALQEVLS